MDRPAGVDIAQALREAGEVGHDLLGVDWAATPLGPFESWPRSLSSIVRVVVSSRFSMWMAWGPELTFFCNDAYRRDTLGKKYPWALGRPAREVWAEIWEDIGPRIEDVLHTGRATWDESLLLFLERSGYAEETYHTFSYSPLTDDRGAIAGMLCVVSEDTERVIGARRLMTLRDLGSVPAGQDEDEYLRQAIAQLETGRRSLPFAAIYRFEDDARTARLAGTMGISAGHAAAPAAITAAHPGPFPLAALANGETAIMHELDQTYSNLPTGDWSEPPTDGILLPLHQPVQPALPYGFLFIGANRYRPLDEGHHGFLELLAAQLAAGIASARAYDAERRRAEELAELDRAKTAFFTNVSHELRTPLTLLIGPAEDALADSAHALDETQRHRIEIIARNSDRLLKLVNTLLDFSRLESGSSTASFEPVELGQYTIELASMFESAVSRSGLTFGLEIEQLSEPVYVDREMWAKVVLNLISNALKYTFEGGITVRLSAADRRVRLTVVDTGVGIDPGEQARLFDRFHRVLGARARAHEGSGIGLALVSELAALHGGEATVQSVPGRGSTFTVEIPLGHAHLPPDQVSQEPRDISIEHQVAGFLAETSRWLTPAEPDEGTAERHPAAAPDDERPRVLVVDDNADMRAYVVDLLSEEYVVQQSADGAEALEMARAAPPDLVLTDVMMPRLDGFGLISALNSDPLTMFVPVVMLSARAGEEGIIEGLEAGADDYLVKPFSARELLARVRANLELDRVRRTRDQLQRGQQLLNDAERLAEVGSWEIDLASGLMLGSDQLLRMIEIGRGEFEELRYAALIERTVHPDDRELARATLAAASTDGKAFDVELRVLRGDGSPGWMRVRGEAVLDDQGVPEILRGSIQDITQRHAAEQAIAVAAAAREAAQHEHRIADTLQRSLLPPPRFESDYLEVATFYQAGVEGTRVGGDWYDVIELGAGRTSLVIGDVVGRGVPAASVMGQLRAAVRAYARLDLPPADLLELLDAMVRELGDEQLVTCIYCVYDPAERELRFANAGHLPPLLAAPDGTTVRLGDSVGAPLGVGALHPAEQRLLLEPGALITLYTDGLVERRDRDLDIGIDELAARVTAASEDIRRLPSELARALAPEGSEDDIAILVARASVDTAQQTAVLEVGYAASAPQGARRFAMSTLREWGLPEELVEDATLIVSELLTNAILHGRPPIQLRLRRTRDEISIEVDDAATAMPRRLRVGPQDEHGRGLAIVAELADRWAVRAHGHGKTVWGTLLIPGEAAA